MIKKKLKKKRILVLGCSFSRGAYASEQYSQSEAKCWPQILAEKYRDSDWWVFNTATCGNTDAMMMLELEHYTKNNEWDMVVVQNTTPARATFMHDSKQARDYINIKYKCHNKETAVTPPRYKLLKQDYRMCYFNEWK